MNWRAATMLTAGALTVGPVMLGAAPAGAARPGVPPAEEVQVVQLELVDETRATPAIGADPGAPTRTIATTIYLPAGDGPAPLVVLAHGFDGHPRKFTELAVAWAEAGIVVAVPRFPVSADDAAGVAGAVFAERVADVGEQAKDLSFVIDEVLVRSNATPASAATDDELSGRVDGDHIGLFGLSLGSLTVWTAVSGPTATEARVDAVIQSDGIGPPAPWPGPLLVAHSDVDPIFPYASTRDQLCVEGGGPTWLLTLFGAAHAVVGEDTPTPADQAYREATTTFWQRTLTDATTTAFPPTVTVDGVTRFESSTDDCTSSCDDGAGDEDAHGGVDDETTGFARPGTAHPIAARCLAT